jgi:hypothetical protein
VLPKRTWEAVTKSQKVELSKRAAPGNTKEENWYIMFSILFPGYPKPRSPYLEPEFADGLLAVREFAAENVPTITQQILAEQNLEQSFISEDEIPIFTETVVREAFDILLAAFESRLPQDNSTIINPVDSNDTALGEDTIQDSYHLTQANIPAEQDPVHGPFGPGDGDLSAALPDPNFIGYIDTTVLPTNIEDFDYSNWIDVSLLNSGIVPGRPLEPPVSPTLPTMLGQTS